MLPTEQEGLYFTTSLATSSTAADTWHSNWNIGLQGWDHHIENSTTWSICSRYCSLNPQRCASLQGLSTAQMTGDICQLYHLESAEISRKQDGNKSNQENCDVPSPKVEPPSFPLSVIGNSYFNLPLDNLSLFYIFHVFRVSGRTKENSV